MKTFILDINNTEFTIEAQENSMLLWILREQAGLTGTKYSCGIGQCGSCTVHLDGKPIRSCLLPVSSINKGQKITTIEGLSEQKLHPVQQAWIDAQVPQCGFCQSGQIMQAASLLDENPRPTRAEIRTYMNGNLCRCGTYMRIMEAIEIAAEKMPQSS
ncbi:MAG: (2Fe-2S)-binding protein [Eudoraea sp.]|nr:(2Fe-2S)-binding protein [Eudoraea sp.]